MKRRCRHPRVPVKRFGAVRRMMRMRSRRSTTPSSPPRRSRSKRRRPVRAKCGAASSRQRTRTPGSRSNATQRCSATSTRRRIVRAPHTGGPSTSARTSRRPRNETGLRAACTRPSSTFSENKAITRRSRALHCRTNRASDCIETLASVTSARITPSDLNSAAGTTSRGSSAACSRATWHLRNHGR